MALLERMNGLLLLVSITVAVACQQDDPDSKEIIVAHPIFLFPCAYCDFFQHIFSLLVDGSLTITISARRCGVFVVLAAYSVVWTSTSLRHCQDEEQLSRCDCWQTHSTS